jgi:hypothetical protein
MEPHVAIINAPTTNQERLQKALCADSQLEVIFVTGLYYFLHPIWKCG